MLSYVGFQMQGLTVPTKLKGLLLRSKGPRRQFIPQVFLVQEYNPAKGSKSVQKSNLAQEFNPKNHQKQ